MKRFLAGYLSIIVCVLLNGCEPVAPENAWLGEVNRILDRQYQGLKTEASLLAASAETFCQHPSAANETIAKQVQLSWQQANLAWMRVQGINTQALLTDNRAWYFQFWPDRKNITQKQVEALLTQANENAPENAANDASAQNQINLATLAERGVVVQGMNAIEYQLFDPSIDLLAYRGERCQLLMAQTQLLSQRATELDQALTPIANEATAINQLVNDLIGWLETIKIKKLGLPLGIKNNVSAAAQTLTPKPYEVESWRSQTSLTNIEQNLMMIRQLLDVDQHVATNRAFQPSRLFNQLPNDDAQRLTLALATQFDVIDAQLKGIKTPLFDAVTTDTAAVQQLYQQVGQLIGLLKRDVLPALNIPLSFNANDGD